MIPPIETYFNIQKYDYLSTFFVRLRSINTVIVKAISIAAAKSIDLVDAGTIWFGPLGAVMRAQLMNSIYIIMLRKPKASNLSPISYFLITSVRKKRDMAAMMPIRGDGWTKPSTCLHVNWK